MTRTTNRAVILASSFCALVCVSLLAFRVSAEVDQCGVQLSIEELNRPLKIGKPFRVGLAMHNKSGDVSALFAVSSSPEADYSYYFRYDGRSEVKASPLISEGSNSVGELLPDGWERNVVDLNEIQFPFVPGNYELRVTRTVGPIYSRYLPFSAFIKCRVVSNEIKFVAEN